jgi:L-malate glycosyltransferase
MVIASFAPRIGGAERQAELLAHSLVQDGCRVRVLTRLPSPASYPELPEVEFSGGVEIHRIPSSLPGRLGSLQYLVLGLLKAREWSDVDVFHAHDVGTPGILALLCRAVLGGGTVVKLRTGSDIYRQHWPPRLRRKLLNHLLRRHDRVAVVSGDLEEFAQECGVLDARLVRIPNTVRGDVFGPAAPGKPLEVRRTLGLPTGKHLFLYVGRLEKVKGVDVLLQAWARIQEVRRSGACLVLVGEGSEGEALRCLSEGLGLGASVRFEGEKGAVREYYQAADVFVLPSRAEGLSNALMEAMASGLPVLGSAVGGAVDLIVDGETGYLVPPEDPSALSTALEAAFSDQGKWKEFGANASARVRSVAGADVVMGKWGEVYRSLAREKLEGREGG